MPRTEIRGVGPTIQELDHSRQTPVTEPTEIRNSVSRQDAESQRGAFCCLSLRLRDLARNIMSKTIDSGHWGNALQSNGR